MIIISHGYASPTPKVFNISQECTKKASRRETQYTPKECKKKYWQYACERECKNARNEEGKKEENQKKKKKRPRHPHAHQSIQPFHPSDVKSFPYLPFSHTNSRSQSPHVPRAQPRERIRAVPSTASKTLEVSALVAHMSSAIGRHVPLRRLLRLVERVHVTAQRHGDAALRSLHLLLLLRNAVFGKRLERSLGSKLRVVV